MLKEQRHEMQRQHEEEQQSLLWLQEAAEACRAECVAQKARKEVEAKAKEEAEKWRIAKKKKLEYIQQLWDKMLEEEVTLLEGAKGSQVMGSKCKEVAIRDEKGQRPSKKTRGMQPGKYCGDATVKMRSSNPCERCVRARQNCLVHPSR